MNRSNTFTINKQRKDVQEFENLFDELFETKKDGAMDVMRFVYDKPHQYLMMNLDSQRMYKGFDELILKEPEY